MCLILFNYRTHGHHELVLAANRDEFYTRPTAPMDFWDDAPELLAGRDLEAGGTWLGVTRQGRFAAITNYRDPRAVLPEAPSRGALVSDFLKSEESAQGYLHRLASRADRYNGFNLILWDTEELFYFSNQHGDPRPLAPGLYGLSNHLLDTPWPKVRRGRRKLATVLEDATDPSSETLLELLRDPTPAADEALPDTGITLEWERILSPMFIESPAYGTRSSTVLRMGKEGNVEIAEKTWATGEVREFRFTA